MEGKKLVQELIVPVERGIAYRVNRGQIQRVIMIDGPQVGDMAVFNADNHRETFDPAISYIYNSVQGTGTGKRIRDFYSRPPHINVMLTVTEDTVGSHWVVNGGKCTPFRYKLMGVDGYHRNCFDNLAEAIAPYGLTPEDVPDVNNMFMNVENDEDGRYQFLPPTGGKGDYIDLRAEMDCLVAMSACPAGDQSIINGEGPDAGNKRLKIEIWE